MNESFQNFIMRVHKRTLVSPQAHARSIIYNKDVVRKCDGDSFLGTEHFEVAIDNCIQWYQDTKITFEHQSIKKESRWCAPQHFMPAFKRSVFH